MNGAAALMKRQDGGGGGVVVDGWNAKRMKMMAGRGIAAAEDQVGAAAQGPRRELRLLSDASVAPLAFAEMQLICQLNLVGRFAFPFGACGVEMMWQRRPLG